MIPRDPLEADVAARFGGLEQRLPHRALADAERLVGLGAIAQRVGLGVRQQCARWPRRDRARPRRSRSRPGRAARSRAGSIVSPCARHSAASASASAAVGTTCGAPCWVRIGRPSSATRQPPSAGSTVTSRQNRFICGRPPAPREQGRGRRTRRSARPRSRHSRPPPGCRCSAATPARLDRQPEQHQHDAGQPHQPG